METATHSWIARLLRQHWFRLIFLSILIASLSVLAIGNLPTADGGQEANNSGLYTNQTNLSSAEKKVLAGQRQGGTVFTTFKGPLVALNPNGTVRYADNRHESYWDVDPVEGTKSTVIYSASAEVGQKSCPADVICSYEVIEKANLSTGEVTQMYSQYRYRGFANEWHDIDYLGESRVLVADMAKNRVFIVNTSTNIITWEWEAQSHYSIETGGPKGRSVPGYPVDWTHLNDVEMLDNGLVMVSMRNHDEVLFINQETGVVENRTLGENNNFSILFEQHNPDYIPKENGGPSVVVADSENNRIGEYHYENGTYTKTWQWSDAEMAWPRDADRLPNGNTLVTDSGTSRILEVAPNGTVVWSHRTQQGGPPYDVERLGTGDESIGGPSARKAGLKSRVVGEETVEGPKTSTGSTSVTGKVSNAVVLGLKKLLPEKIFTSIQFVLPKWLGILDLAAIIVLAFTSFVWFLVEVRWGKLSDWIAIQSPIRLKT